VTCGVNEGLVGFSYRDNRGIWRGFDVDVCRAIAAAIFGSPDRVRFVPVSAAQRFELLRSGGVDVLARNTSLTFVRDAGEGLDFPAVTYFDGQGFLVRRSLALTSATELQGAQVCVQQGATAEANLADFARTRDVEVQPVRLPDAQAARDAYGRELCDAFTADISQLASARSLLSDPNGHVILPDVISKETLGPVVRQGDPQWTDIVRWTVLALVAAEEAGITAESVDRVDPASTEPEVLRLLGLEGDLGRSLGLGDRWAADAIRAVGNYAEMFERNVGQESPLKLERGLNALWTAEPRGLMYAPAFR
jgi:general L-amino acid transport system substrate-binding protein